MPLYIFNASEPFESSKTAPKLTREIANLHASTFHTDPALVRVEFAVINILHSKASHGGPGWKPSTGFFEKHYTADYLVVQIPFTGSTEEWKDYCGKLVKLWGYGLRSIYLRQVDIEFEIEEVGREGRITGNRTKAWRAEGSENS